MDEEKSEIVVQRVTHSEGLPDGRFGLRAVLSDGRPVTILFDLEGASAAISSLLHGLDQQPAPVLWPSGGGKVGTTHDRRGIVLVHQLRPARFHVAMTPEAAEQFQIGIREELQKLRAKPN